MENLTRPLEKGRVKRFNATIEHGMHAKQNTVFCSKKRRNEGQFK